MLDKSVKNHTCDHGDNVELEIGFIGFSLFPAAVDRKQVKKCKQPESAEQEQGGEVTVGQQMCRCPQNYSD